MSRSCARAPRIALVGERSTGVHAHSRYSPLMKSLWERERLALDAYWTSTSELDDLRRFDGVWLVPGSPYLSEAGAVAAVRTAREHDLPFLATCGGYLHTLLEFARNVCGLDVAHAENDPYAKEQLIVPSDRPLAGHERRIHLQPGSLAERVVGARTTVERYQCTHELNRDYARVLETHGLRFTGHDDDGVPRVAELPGRRFFLATAFQPELAAGTATPHPVVRSFAAAATSRAHAAA